MFNLETLDTRTASENGKEFAVWRPGSGHPVLDDKGAPVTITLKGRNSDAFRKVQRELQARKLDRQTHDVLETQEDRDAERFEVLVALTVGWSFSHLGAELFPFSPENVRRLWADKRWEWLSLQKFSEVLSEGNFMSA